MTRRTRRHGRPRGRGRIIRPAVAALLVIAAGVVALAITTSAPPGAPIAGGRSGSDVAGRVGTGPTARGTSPSAPNPPSTPPAARPDPSASPSPTPSASRFPGGLLIADRGNGRLIVVTDAGRIAWTFPGPGGLPKGQHFSADDAFIAPDGRSIVANDEAHQVIDRIDVATRRVIWQYGDYNHPGHGPGQLHTPDDAYPLANGDIVVADIRNCRILEIAPSKRIVRHWGRTGVCRDHPPATFANPNGDTPLPDGGLLITEITGSRVVRLAPDGHVAFDIHVPVRYPSDAQLLPDGSILVADYSSPGAVVRLTARGRVLWRYAPRHGSDALDRPSLAIPLPDGTIALNDDFRQRVVVIDPRTNRIVWQYGRTDRAGRGTNRLFTPDGIDLLPPGTIAGLG